MGEPPLPVTMLFAGPRLRVALATIHTGLAAVPRLLTVDGLVATIVQTARALAIYRDLLDKVVASKPDPRNDLGHAHSLSRIYLATARLLKTTGARAEAESLDGERLELWRSWNERLPGNPYVQRQLAITLE